MGGLRLLGQNGLLEVVEWRVWSLLELLSDEALIEPAG
jgi:hypothetical protein